MSKENQWMIETSLERFHQSIQRFQDWMQLSWIDIYDDETLGQGVRALQDIPLSNISANKKSTSNIIVNINEVVTASANNQAADDHVDGSLYLFGWDQGHSFKE